MAVEFDIALNFKPKGVSENVQSFKAIKPIYNSIIIHKVYV